MHRAFLLACLACVLTVAAGYLCGCGDIEEYPKELDPIGPKDVATPMPTAEPSNPICGGVQSFGGGDVWKPLGDNSKSPVFIIRPEFIKPFECRVLLTDGTFSDMRFTGFANGDRQHHRLGDVRTGDAVKCERVSGRSLGGLIECRDEQQICVWAMHKNPCRRAD